MTCGAQLAVLSSAVRHAGHGQVCAQAERRVRCRIAGDDDDVTRKVAEIADAVEHRTVHQEDGWSVPYIGVRKEFISRPPQNANLMFAERVWIRTRATEDDANVRVAPVMRCVCHAATPRQ